MSKLDELIAPCIPQEDMTYSQSVWIGVLENFATALVEAIKDEMRKQGSTEWSIEQMYVALEALRKEE